MRKLVLLMLMLMLITGVVVTTAHVLLFVVTRD
jgi:hypothetical protein